MPYLNYREIIKISDLLKMEEERIESQRYRKAQEDNEFNAYTLGTADETQKEMEFVKSIREKLESEIDKVSIDFTLNTNTKPVQTLTGNDEPESDS